MEIKGYILEKIIILRQQSNQSKLRSPVKHRKKDQRKRGINLIIISSIQKFFSQSIR